MQLLDGARREELSGWAEGDLVELGKVAADGLPDGHHLILAESKVAEDHPLVQNLQAATAYAHVGSIEVDRRGGFGGLDAVAAELRRDTSVGIRPDALAELAKRTLKKPNARGAPSGRVDADSTARFAAEYRKLAGLSPDGIDLRLVEEMVEDRGDQDVWAILDAIGSGSAAAAVTSYRRLVSSSDDEMGARLSFFTLIADYCRQLVATAGAMRALGIRAGERNFQRFKTAVAPRLSGDIPGVDVNPIGRLHPFRLHRVYLSVSRWGSADALADLPWRVLQTEVQLKGESGDPDAAFEGLLAWLAEAGRSGEWLGSGLAPRSGDRPR